jgi:hypothetical protein
LKNRTGLAGLIIDRIGRWAVEFLDEARGPSKP